MGHVPSVAKLGTILIFIVIPFALHALIVEAHSPALILLISLLQLLLLGLVLAARYPARVKVLIVAATAFFALIAWAYMAGLRLTLIPGVPHALTYAALLMAFGGSLLPGHTPILTRVVVSVRGPLPANLMVHTRRVTAAWCCFFAAQLILSLVLYLWAPLEIWSFFINVLNLPLVLLMFAAEYGYRVYRFRDYPHDSFADMIRIVAKTAKTTRQTDSA
jgi:uncharacterized membrane protein